MASGTPCSQTAWLGTGQRGYSTLYIHESLKDCFLSMYLKSVASSFYFILIYSQKNLNISFFFRKIFLFICLREGVWTCKQGAGSRGRGRESSSRLHQDEHGVQQCGTRSHNTKIMTWAKISSPQQLTNWTTQESWAWIFSNIHFLEFFSINNSSYIELEANSCHRIWTLLLFKMK